MMTCKDFVERVDLYLDRRLARAEQSSVDKHLRDCEACRGLAGTHQERQVVLRTAVTDVVAAVDLSGLWSAVQGGIEGELPAHEGVAWNTVWSGLRRRVRRWSSASPLEALTPLRLTAGAAAAVAVLFVVFSLSGSHTARVQVVAQHSPTSVSTPRTHTRNVRIDSLEAAEGHTVATWVQPRTGAQVIWVADVEATTGPMSLDLQH